MVTDLLLAGLMLASAPDLLPQGTAMPAASVARPHVQAVPAPCSAAARSAAQAALIEAHAGYASLPPFSLARLRGGAAAAHEGPAREKDAPACKS